MPAGRIQGVVEECETGPTRLLGAVHCGISLHDQFFDGFAVFREQGNTDGCAYDVLHTLYHHRFHDGGDDPLANFAYAFLFVDASDDDRKLVAAETGNGVGLAQRRFQALADLYQQSVARLVPFGVVDLLESVQINEQHRALFAAPGPGDALL